MAPVIALEPAFVLDFHHDKDICASAPFSLACRMRHFVVEADTYLQASIRKYREADWLLSGCSLWRLAIHFRKCW